MKPRVQILLVMFFVSFLNAQNSDWKEIKKNYFQKIVIENKNDFLKLNDSLEITTFEIEEPTGTIENFDFAILKFHIYL